MSSTRRMRANARTFAFGYDWRTSWTDAKSVAPDVTTSSRTRILVGVDELRLCVQRLQVTADSSRGGRCSRLLYCRYAPQHRYDSISQFSLDHCFGNCLRRPEILMSSRSVTGYGNDYRTWIEVPREHVPGLLYAACGMFQDAPISSLDWIADQVSGVPFDVTAPVRRVDQQGRKAYG